MNQSDKAFLQAFENQGLPFAQWNHEAHVRMAFLMMEKYGDEANLQVVLALKAYNAVHAEHVKVGYHETLTQFWLQQIQTKHQADESYQSFQHRHPELLQFGYIFQFYTKERLFSELARTQFVPYNIGENEAER